LTNELMLAPVVQAHATTQTMFGNEVPPEAPLQTSDGWSTRPIREQPEILRESKPEWRRQPGSTHRLLRALDSSPVPWRPLALITCGLAIAGLLNLVQQRILPRPTSVTTPVSGDSSGMRHAEIRGLEATWVTASADGKPIFSKIISKGERSQVQFSKYAFLHLGNAKGVEVNVDGQWIQIGREPGRRLLKVQPSGFSFIPWTNDDPTEP